MSELFPRPPAGPGVDPEPTEHLDRSREVRESRYRWILGAARWRAHALAEIVFGGEVSVRLPAGSAEAAASGHYPFRGLLHMDVPFLDLEVHRSRERIFLACAGADPVLSRVPFLYVFRPDPAREGREP